MNNWNFWSVIQQIIIVLSIIMQLYVAIKIVKKASGAEQMVRVTAIATGVLIFLGSQTFEVTFADLMLSAISNLSLKYITIISTLVPAIIGILMAQITINTVNKGTNFAIRILLLIGVFTLFQILYLNYYAVTKTTLPISKALIPNLSYSLSVMLWVIFNFEERKGRYY